MTIRRVVDLSLPLGPATQVYPGDPVPSIRPATTIEAEGFNVAALELGTHSGTHVDAPYHFLADGARLEDLDPASFAGPAVIADVTGREPRERIAWPALEPVTERLGPGTILVLRTGWSDLHHGTPAYLDHPFLSADAAERVLELGVRTLAVDTLSPDETVVDGPPPAFDVHLAVLGAGGVIAENLTNLGAVDFDDPYVSLFPLRLAGDADGAPCRAVAFDLGGATPPAAP